MPRIPNDQLERLKRDTSLVRVAESQGHKLTRQGKDYVVCCPFHEEKTPSCVLSPKTNLFHCFGCGAGGSVIDWVMKTQGVSFRLACELLLKDIGAVATPAPSRPVKKATTQKLNSSLTADLQNADVQGALRRVVDYYHQTLLDSPDALAYLEKRGLNHPELIKAFRLGYANRTLAYHIPQKNREAGQKLRKLLQEAGIYRASGHEHFNGSLIVPIFNDAGQIVEIYGRKTRDDLRKGTPRHLYLPGAHKGVFNEAGLTDQEEILLCEALLDAMTFWVHGFKNVTASYGIQGFTEDHLALFKQCGVKRVLIAYDRDEGGDQAASVLAARLQSEGLECFRVLFPQGLDANSWACEAKSPTEARERLSAAIRKATWLGQGEKPKRKSGSPLAAASSLAASPAASAAGKAAEKAAPAKVRPSAEVPPKADQAPEPPVPSSPVPSTWVEDVCCEVTEREVLLTLGSRMYRVRGLPRNTQAGQLKVNLLACNDQGFHTDSLELYQAKQRQVFINQACIELGVTQEVIKKDLGKVLLKLEALQDDQRQAQAPGIEAVATLSHSEQAQALELLKAPDLLERIVQDINSTGIVGEDHNVLVAYLACVSRKLDKPLAVMIQSSSAAGKSSLMDSVLALMPEGERVQYSAMTGQSLYYMGSTDLKHKILAIAEEEGVSNASYALKLLQSEGEVTIASTGKDETTGDLVTKEYKVEGPVMLLMTTTAIDIDEELMNRCLVLSVNESRAQTQAIHAAQRQKRTLAGLKARHRQSAIVSQHRHAQQLLRPLAVINPYADQLTFVSDKTRTRRDHEKYLTLIDSVALLYQYQREVKQLEVDGQAIDYIEVSLPDIERANRLAHEVLGRTLDELPPQTRKLLNLIQEWVHSCCREQQVQQSDFRFSRRAIRDLCGWGNTQLKVHLGRLEDMEYLLVHRGGRGQSFEYELVYFASESPEQRCLMGLKPLETLQKYHYDKKKSGLNANKSGLNGKKSGPSRPQVGPRSGGGRPPENGRQATAGEASGDLEAQSSKNAVLREKTEPVVVVSISGQD